MTQDLWTAFARTAAGRGDDAALWVGEDTVTYRAWLASAGRFADAAARAGVGAGDRVIVWTGRPASTAAAVCGSWAVGAIPAMLNADAPATHRARAVASITPAAVAVDDTSPAAPEFRDVTAVTADPGTTPAFQPGHRLPTDPASIVFTSGSTGRPKAVTQSHGNILRGSEAVTAMLGLRPDDRLLCAVPWSFDYGFVQLHAAALRGIPLVVSTAPNPFAVCQAIEQHRPTVLAGLPSLYTYLMQGLSPLPKTDTTCFRLLMNTGGTIPEPVRLRLADAFPKARIALNYGLTETYRTTFLDPADYATHAHTVGRPIPGADVAIVRDDGTLAEPDEEGQIVHRGDYVCLGYWGDPEATAKALRPDPLAPPGHPNPPRVMYTGDYGLLDADGRLHFRGRRDHLLKSMGVRVSPSEVEALLWKSGLVSECAVVGRKHDMLGDEVCAAVVLAPDAGDDPLTRLKAYARQAMSPYMQPRQYRILDALPKTPHGKVDYPALRTAAAR